MATQAVKNRLRALRKKHHLGEFRNSKKSHSRHRQKGVTMAKKKYSRRRKSVLGSGITPIALGAGGFILYESFISPMIPLSEPSKSVVELLGGLFLMRKGGIIGNAAKAAVYINTYQLMALYLKPMIAGNPISTF